MSQMMMDGWMMGGWWFGWMVLWSLLVLAGLVFLIYGVVRLAQSRAPAAASTDQGSSARRILDERFARGEIDEEEYRRRRDQLS